MIGTFFSAIEQRDSGITVMALKRYTNKEIDSKLQQIALFVATGDLLAQACKEAGISKQSYYRWQKNLADRMSGDREQSENA
jgi:transposase-like protein